VLSLPLCVDVVLSAPYMANGEEGSSYGMMSEEMGCAKPPLGAESPITQATLAAGRLAALSRPPEARGRHLSRTTLLLSFFDSFLFSSGWFREGR
jgi:hypothetical protein